MKQNAGIFTALAVVLAVFGLSSIPKGSPSGGGIAAPSSAHGTKSAVKIQSNTNVIYACRKIQERLQTLMPDASKSAGPSGDQWKLPDSCYGSGSKKALLQTAPDEVIFAIAAAPNPVTTHLALLFDRTIEIIEQAAQDNNYSYDSSWLPWSVGKEYARYPDQRASEDSQSETEKQPGVLVFRRPLGLHERAPYRGGLVVFVVSELPTGGIDEDEFKNAVEWIAKLGRVKADREFKILGPTFSGSLPSLYQLLQAKEFEAFKNTGKIHVSSGSVSSDFSFQWFRERLNTNNFGTFDTDLEGDCRMLRRFVTYVGAQGYSIKRIAVLSEDETAFGGRVDIDKKDDSAANHNSPSDPEICEYSQELTYVYYPRDIATLRSAYEQQSIFNSGKQGSQGANSSSTTLRSDLSEPENSEHDTVRTYGGQLTPLAQESVLQAITDVLATKRIDFVILRSTNSLDQIFLSQFLRRSFPDARLVLDDSDMLFRRGAEGASLRGVMVLSTFPLLTWEQDWTSSEKDEGGGSYRIFGQDNAEGLYIAARELLLHDPALEPVSIVKIANYTPPPWARSKTGQTADDQRPATWLTVIGHRQFWPVAVLNANTLNDREPISLLPIRKDSLIEIGGNSDPIRFLPAEFQILLIVCFLWGTLHFLFCCRGSISPNPAFFRLAYFAPVPRWQYAALIGFGSVVMISVAVLLGSASGLLSWKLGKFNGWVVFEITWIILLACVGWAVNYGMPAMECSTFSPGAAQKSRLITAVACTVFLAGFVAFRVELLHRLTTANQIPLFWRCIHLLSGVSPLLPQLILAAGLYAWFWYCLRGLALFGNDRPQLPEESELPVTGGKPLMPMFSCEGAGQPTEAEAIPLGKNYLLVLAIIFPIVFLICLVVMRGVTLRVLGEHEFGVYMFVWLTICIALILADASQCWTAWLRLRELLQHLDRLAVRRTLYALQGLSWRSVWAMSGNVLAERYSLISRELEAMRHLENQLNSWTADPGFERGQAILIWKIHQFQKVQMRALTEWYLSLNGKVETVAPMRDAQAEIASIVAETTKRILIPSWRLEMDSLLLSPPNPKDKDADKSAGPVISAEVKPHVLAAEEFFVLPYVGFIQNILGRIRTSVLGSLCLFVATTLAMSSYPFDPLPVHGGIFLTVFVIIGTTMILIYAGMHRDATLSYLTGTQPGELGGEFWRQLITFGIGPLLGLLTTLFPSITDFVVSWLQPSAQAIK